MYQLSHDDITCYITSSLKQNQVLIKTKSWVYHDSLATGTCNETRLYLTLARPGLNELTMTSQAMSHSQRLWGARRLSTVKCIIKWSSYCTEVCQFQFVLIVLFFLSFFLIGVDFVVSWGFMWDVRVSFAILGEILCRFFSCGLTAYFYVD